MSYNIKNVKELQERLLMWRITPERARKNVCDSINLLEDLLVATSDAKRLRIFDKIEKRFTGMGNLENLLIWSALANPSPATLTGRRKIEKARQAEIKRRERYLDDVGKILHKGTGLDKKLCRDIMDAHYHSRKMKKSWPVKINMNPFSNEERPFVTGPKGGIPLIGDGSPHYIYDNLRGQVT